MKIYNHITIAAVSLFIAVNTSHAQIAKASQTSSTSDEVTQQEPETIAPEQATPAIKKEKKICKSTAPTGSRIGKKTCLTKAAWDEMGRKARTTLDSSTRPTSNNKQGE